MDANQINQTVELLPLVGSDLHKAGAYYVGPCPMCGGKDRFTVMHTNRGDRWHCRQCGDGKYHGVIDYIMQRDHVSFVEACKALSGGAEVVLTPARQPARQPATTQKEPTLPDAPTQARLLAAMDAASDALYTTAGQQAQEYLRSRGLALGTWYAWQLGAASIYDPKAQRKRPALSIPWYYQRRREFITAIKYRFIDDAPNGLRYTSAPGSVPILYGTWDIQTTDKTLLLVEGELNALSLWQQRPQDTTVLSIGSEGGGNETVLRRIASHYQRVFIWCDDAPRTLKYKAMIAQVTKGLQSPTIDGAKVDANKLLQIGKIGEFINAVIGVNCQQAQVIAP